MTSEDAAPQLTSHDEQRLLSPRSRLRRVAIFALCAAVAIVLCVVADLPLVNNGDYWRVASFLHLSIPSHVAVASTYSFTAKNSNSLGPGSLFAVVAAVLYPLARNLGFRAFDVNVLFVLESLVYFVGVYFASERLESRRGRIACLLFFLIYLLYGFILKSYYEEAMVLVVAPWVYFGLVRLETRGKFALFAVAGCLAIVSKSEVQVAIPALIALLIAYMPHDRASVIKAAVSALALIGSAGIMLHESNVYQFTPVNAYDRVMYGIGLAMSGVATKPGVDASAWASSQGVDGTGGVPRSACGAIPVTVRGELGTPYWPVGASLATSSSSMYREAVAAGSWRNYARDLVLCPMVGPELVFNTLVGAVRTNYELTYLQPRASRAPLIAAYEDIRGWVLGHLGWLLIALTTITLVIARSWTRRIVLAAVAFAIPMGVVAGDGFFEFERHLLVFLCFTPLLYFFAWNEWMSRRSMLQASAPVTGDESGVAVARDAAT